MSRRRSQIPPDQSSLALRTDQIIQMCWQSLKTLWLVPGRPAQLTTVSRATVSGRLRGSGNHKKTAQSGSRIALQSGSRKTRYWLYLVLPAGGYSRQLAGRYWHVQYWSLLYMDPCRRSCSDSTGRWPCAGLMLGQRLRRWPNIKPAALLTKLQCQLGNLPYRH